MSGMTLAAIVAGGLALGLAIGMVLLGRQVGRLRAEVQVLAGGRHHVHEESRELRIPSPVAPDELVHTPTPLGPPEVEPDLSVARVASVTLAGPLIRVAAFSYGVRRALAEESRMRIAYAFRKELRRQHKLRRRRTVAAGPPGKEGQRP